MCCNVPVQTGVKNAEDCKCHAAVMRAYANLLKAGRPQRYALEAAKIVYSYHHPEDSALIQGLTVERWINEQSLH